MDKLKMDRDKYRFFTTSYMLAAERDLKKRVQQTPSAILDELPELSDRLRELGLDDEQIAYAFSPVSTPEKDDVELQRKTYIPWGNAIISKKFFCTVLGMIREQEAIDEEFGEALQKVGNGHFVFGTENKYRQALLMLLKETIYDRFDYIEWWLYEGAPDYEVWSADESKKWVLKEPEALYDYITTTE